MEAILNKYAKCDFAINGMEAVAKFKVALDNGGSYDYICLDICMPIMDGNTALSLIREYEKKIQISELDAVKIIVISALDEADIMRNISVKQYDKYFKEPINVERLVAYIQNK